MAMDLKCCSLHLDKQESEKHLGALDLRNPLSHGTYPKTSALVFMVKMREQNSSGFMLYSAEEE